MSDSIHLTVEAAYNRWAAGYDDYENPMVYVARHVLSGLDVRTDQAVVEFGCGTGRNLALLSDAGVPCVLGLDFSLEMLRRVPVEHSGISLIRHDTAGPAPLRDACADMILFCLTLEHMEDLEQPFAEAARVLKPTGRIVLFEIHPFFAFQGGKAHFKDGAATVSMPTYPHLFSDYVDAARSAGLYLDESREWRPKDLISENQPLEALPPKVVKRGLDMPLGLSLTFRHLS